jgi:YegS/Rv2252/BmrU family lipid kinase
MPHLNEKVLFLLNTAAGPRRNKKLDHWLLEKAAHYNKEAVVMLTNPEGNYQDLAQKITQEKFGAIGICGGDGTITPIIDQLAPLRIPFGIIPVGSGNGLAFSAKIPANPAKALALFFAETPQWMDAFRINNRLACCICGLGLDAQVAHEFALQPKRGLQTYIRLTARSFFSAKTFPFQITTPDSVFSTQAFLAVVANGNQFGNHFTIAPRASLQDGKLDIVILQKMNKLKLLGNTLRQLISGSPNNHPQGRHRTVMYLQTSKIHIDNPGKAPFQIDGEPCPAPDHLDIEILPRYYQLIAPAK